MKNIESAVAQHYGNDNLVARIMAGLEAAGADINVLQMEDLAPVDEFHIGGREATKRAVAKMALGPDSRVLDIGCGIGGAVRYIADEFGCQVTGIDLTPEFISTAQALSIMTGQGDMARFEIASALDMPFDAAAFDAAVTFHVAMNIPDREGLYGEIARVLAPGGVLCIYDVMKKSDEPLSFPVPWSETPDTSHLTTPDEMLVLLTSAGFEVEYVEDRTNAAIEIFKQSEAAAANDGLPLLGVHLIMGPTAPQKFKNTRENIENGLIGPVLMVARRKG
ncbi:MAG: methyltransferase domain-containing protein [Rhodospirillales bacterium]|nr:methyltransferase domain-containing protein [Rhodospirillales bacterium]